MISRRISNYIKSILFLAIFPVFLSAQATLVDENFNDCILPDSWSVDIEGNPDVVWYIDDINQNVNSDSSSIDGTCMIAIDDDASGNNTPPFVIRFSSAEFNGLSMRRLFIELDINFRVHAGNFMRVIINDGENDHILKEYNPDSGTGPQFSDFDHLEIEATAYASTQNTFIIEFEDTGSFGWYGAFDNVYIWSEGEGVTMYSETFDDCVIPANWTTNIVTGEDDWQFGIAPNGQTMNGSCFAYFDDDALGDTAAFSLVELSTPPFDGTVYKELYMDYEIIMRSVNENEGINIIIESDGVRHNLASFYDGHGGPQFYEFENETHDLSLYKSSNMRIIFQYDDGNQWGWWVGIDNIFVYGIGEPTDVCEKARDVFLNQDCLDDTNIYSANDGVANTCTDVDDGSLWFRYEALVSGKVHISTNAKYNDVVTLFTGDCNNLLGIDCSNRDEYGFTGENIYFEAIQSQVYYIRTAGFKGEFGTSRGDLCIQLESIDEYPVIADNDLCNNATVIQINEDCISSQNWHSTTSNHVPSQNSRARADVWYQFQSNVEAEALEIKTYSNFSESIILYKGDNCTSLLEIASNEKGKKLVTPILDMNTHYFIQITSFFATTEGAFCLDISPAEEEIANNNCIEAVSLTLGDECLESTNIGSDFSGTKPTCIQNAQSDIWFSFIAPASASIKILPEFDFISGMGLYNGPCDTLVEIGCWLNPQKCDGYITIDDLEPGTEYFIQVLSTNDHLGIENSGDICLQILDGSSIETYAPMTILTTFDCTDFGIGELTYTLNGGVGDYVIIGDANGSIIHTGDSYIVVAKDDWGCEVSIQGLADCGGEACDLLATIDADTINCTTLNVETWVDVQSGYEPFTYLWSTGDTTEQITVPSNEIDVNVIVTDSQNCVVNLVPTFIQDTASASIALDQLTHIQGANLGSISVSIEGDNIEIEWYYGFAFYSNDEDITDLEAGEYSILVTNTVTGCITAELYVIEHLISNQNIGDKSLVQVNSNLTKEEVIIVYNMPSNTDFNITFYDLLGRQILSQKHAESKGKQSIKVGHFAPGNYKLLITTDDNFWMEDVVVYE